MRSFLLAAWSLVMRDYRVRFRRTILGIAWFFVPLFSLVGMALLLGTNLGLYSQGQSSGYFVQLLAGLILWQLMADTWLEPMRLARRANMLLRSVVFDTRILLAAGALSAMLAFALKLPVLIAVLVWFNVQLLESIIWLPIAMCVLVACGMAMACFTLPLSLALLDVRYAMPFVQYALLLATPIFYTSPAAGPVAWLNQSNPLSHLVIPLRDLLIGVSTEAGAIAVPLILTACLLITGLFYYRAKIRLAIAYIGY
jgi:ABC-type polysaccharide/polyol phosphate export permease